jgi:hypothetical protein
LPGPEWGLDLGLPLRWDYAGSFCGGG